MIAGSMFFPERLSPASAVAFGNVIDLARFRQGSAGAEVCGACNTINPGSAKFCKGCTGKLPAFYASVGRGETAPARVVSQGPTLRRHRLAVAALWGVAVLVALFEAFGPRQAEPLRAGQPHEIGVAEVQLPAAELLPGAAPMSTVTQATADAGQPGSLRRSPSASTSSRAAASSFSRSDVPSPLARCGGMNFFSHAVCMNNTCAQPALRRSPQCVDVVRQRRLDEARRNPTLIG